MKAKLIKVENTFYLKQGETTLATSSSPNLSASIRYSLSKQNCDEIFGVVDVEKLAEECAETAHTMDELYENGLFYGFVSGFNKAMELNKDKVFTLEYIHAAFGQGWERSKAEKNGATFYDEKSRFIQSLQQPTEIEVTFNPDEKDSEGCLILKRVV